MKRWLAALLCLLAALPAQAAGDRIWSALVLATRETPPKPVPPALTEAAPVLKKVFGYDTFYLMGQKKRDITADVETWLVPSKELFFKVTLLKQEKTHYLVRIELYQEKKLLLSTEARLARDAPLYIRGPQWGKGQLILLLEIV